MINWLKNLFLSDDDFKPRVRKESKKVDDTSEQKESKPKVIDKENDISFESQSLKDILIQAHDLSNKDLIFKDILEFISKENYELFEFVKILVENGKKGVTIDHEELTKLIHDLINKLVKEDVEYSKLYKKDALSKELAIQGYATTNLFSLVKYLNDKLNEYEDNKFKKWKEIETYYSIYLLIYDTITEH